MGFEEILWITVTPQPDLFCDLLTRPKCLPHHHPLTSGTFENTSEQLAASPEVTSRLPEDRWLCLQKQLAPQASHMVSVFQGQGHGASLRHLNTRASPDGGATPCLKVELCPARAGNSYGFVTLKMKFHMVSYRQG